MDDRELQEQAYEIASYIHKHPAKKDVHTRVNWLTGYRVANLDVLVTEVEAWLEKFK